MRYATFFCLLAEDAHRIARQTGEPVEEVLTQQLRSSAALGVDGMTMAYTELTEENLKLVKQCGLRVDLVYWSSRLVFGEDGDQLQEVAEKIASTGADVLMLLAGSTGGALTDAQERANAYPLARELVKHCENAGIHCGMENFGGLKTTYSTIDGVKDYLDHVEGLGAVLDIGNAIWQRQDAMQMWDMMKNRIVAVHAKDVSLRPVEGVRQNRTPWGDLITPLPIGDGDAPMAQLIPAIRDSGFNGSVTFEHDGYPDTMHFLHRSIDFWKAHC